MEELYVFNSDFGMKCHFKKTKYGSRGGGCFYVFYLK